MKSHQSIFIFLISVFALMFFQCKQSNRKDFIESIAKQLENKDPIEATFWVDSLINNNQPNDEELAVLFYFKGNNLDLLGKYSESLHSFEKADSLWKKENSPLDSLMVTASIFLGTEYSAMNRNEEAIQVLQNAINDANKLNNPYLLAHAYSALARCHYTMNDIDKAFEYLNKSLKVYEKNDDQKSISAIYNNMAILYRSITNYEKAEKFNLLSLEISKKLEDSLSIAKSYNNLGNLKIDLQQYEKALPLFQRAIEINEKSNHLNPNPYENIGILKKQLNQPQEAEKYYLKAVEIAKKTGAKHSLKNFYSDLISLKLEEKEIDGVLIYQKLKDSMELEINLETSQKEKEFLEKEFQSIQNKEAAENKIRLNQVIFISIFGIFFTAVIILYLKLRNNQLKTQAEKQKLEQKVLRTQMNPHFIFNTLSAVQNSLLKNDAIQSAGYLSDFAKMIRQNFDFVSKEKISLEEEIDALENYIKTQQLRFQHKFDYEIIFSENWDWQMESVPPLILQPLVENAIEHGFDGINSKGNISINIEKQKEDIQFTITDNGKGYLPKDNGKKEHALDICRKRLRLMGKAYEKSFQIENTGNGTQVSFKIPAE